MSDNHQLCLNFDDNIAWHFFQRLKTKFRGILFRPLEYRIRGQRGHILHAYRHVVEFLMDLNFQGLKIFGPHNWRRMDLGIAISRAFWCLGGSDCIDCEEELQMASLDIFH